jgi:DNA-binding CsgD family transcriptional regulator/tetratricopeptide (TPR) repeat protein
VPGMEVGDAVGLRTLFVGRAAERDIIARLTADTASGRPWTVLVEGDAGTGKSALLRYPHPGLDVFATICARSDAAEASLPFGLIAQLLAEARTLADPAQTDSRAIRQDSPPAVVGSALLDLLRAAEQQQPIAVIIDDLQWADDASVEAITFALRRLGTARVLTVLSARTTAGRAEHWPAGRSDVWRRLVDSREFGLRLRLRGLAVAEVAELAQLTGHGPVPLAVASRLRRHTDGNPAYLRALLAELPPDRPVPLDGSLPVPALVAAHVAHVLASLPEPSVRLAEALAVLDTRCAPGRAGQVAGVADPVTALGSLLESGLVRWLPENPVTMAGLRVPAERDALYRSLTPPRRRELHSAAAGLVPEDAAWVHRVAAASGPDHQLAGELEAAASARGSGGSAEQAGRLLLWAAGLSDDQDDYERRLLAGVAQLIWCRRTSDAAALREPVAGCVPRPLRDLILVALEPAGNKIATLESMMTDVLAAAEEAPGLRQATARVVLALARDEGGADAAVAGIASHVLTMHDLDAASAQFARCLLAEATGRLAGGPHLALRELDGLGSSPSLVASAPADAMRLWRRGVCRVAIGQLTAAANDLSAALRSAGGLVIAGADTSLAYAHYLLGEWDAAESAADRAAAAALSQCVSAAYAQACAVAACIAASRGDWAQAEAHIRGVREWPHDASRGSIRAGMAVAMATSAQARGDHAAVLAALDHPLAVGGLRQYQFWWRPMHVEALIVKGRLDDAAAALAMLTALAEGAPCLEAGIAWLSGLLAHRQGDALVARVRFEDALAAPVPKDDIPLLRAWLEHAYGKLLLAQRDRQLGTTWIARAHHRYAALGAHSYLERCETDSSVCGLNAGNSNAAARTRTVLSAQEYRVAHLVAQGLTNQEVAGELFVSAKTVEYHLTNIFTKLDITSRRQLRALLSAGEPAEAPPGVAPLAVAQTHRRA